MSRNITDQQWAAARSISEGLAATHARIAGVMGVHQTTVAHRALEDGWASVDYRLGKVRRAQAWVQELSRRLKAGEEVDVDEDAAPAVAAAEEAELEPWPDEPPAARIARIGAVLTRRTEAVLRKVEAGQPLDARQITALSSLVALSERIADMARAEMDQQQKQGDEELAEIYRNIEARIAYLALEEARRLAVDVLGMSIEEVDAKLPGYLEDGGAADEAEAG
ncbi:MAG: hypothetical protein MEQ84_00675 [Mesorhizobium sp.]|nr:hypothetical protein [Mesorhizobium sp.]